jgi:hypothetical protein
MRIVKIRLMVFLEYSFAWTMRYFGLVFLFSFAGFSMPMASGPQSGTQGVKMMKSFFVSCKAGKQKVHRFKQNNTTNIVISVNPNAQRKRSCSRRNFLIGHMGKKNNTQCFPFLPSTIEHRYGIYGSPL